MDSSRCGAARTPVNPGRKLTKGLPDNARLSSCRRRWLRIILRMPASYAGLIPVSCFTAAIRETHGSSWRLSASDPFRRSSGSRLSFHISHCLQPIDNKHAQAIFPVHVYYQNCFIFLFQPCQVYDHASQCSTRARWHS